MKHLKNKLDEEVKKIIGDVETRGDFTPAELEMLHKLMGVLYYMDESGEKKMSNGSKPSASDELEDADKYWHEYEKTKEHYCLDIAKDELRHAKILLDMMPEAHKDKPMMLDWYADLDSKINDPKTHKSSYL